jgi:hypothetical protein
MLQGTGLFRVIDDLPSSLTNQQHVQLKVCLVQGWIQKSRSPSPRKSKGYQSSVINLQTRKRFILPKVLKSSTMQNFGLLRTDTGIAELRAIPIPELRQGYILVKTVAVALNPTDWTSLDAVGNPGTIVGCDYAGIVEQVGAGGSNRFKKGDRIAGFAHGGML